MGHRCHKCRKRHRHRHKHRHRHRTRRKRCNNLPVLSVTNNEQGQQEDIVTPEMKVALLNFNTDNQDVSTVGWTRVGYAGTHFKCLVSGIYRVHYTAAYKLSNIVDNSLVSTNVCILVNGTEVSQSITRNKDWVLASNPMVQTHTQQKGILMNFDSGDVMSTQFSFSREIENEELIESDLAITYSLADEQHIDINMVNPILLDQTESIGLES